MTDGELAKSLLDVIFKTYGWKSTSCRLAIDDLIDDVRKDEQKKFARFVYRFLVENEFSTVSEVLDRIRNNDQCRADAICE